MTSMRKDDVNVITNTTAIPVNSEKHKSFNFVTCYYMFLPKNKLISPMVAEFYPHKSKFVPLVKFCDFT